MNAAIARTEFHSSELSRNSSEVFSAAEAHPVKITRRNAEPLILMSEKEADARRVLFEFAATLIAVTTDDRGTLAERMADRFPWMLALPLTDREACANELVDAARASFSTEYPHLTAAVLTSWKETASAIAAGLSSRPVEWLEPEISLERPKLMAKEQPV